MFGLNEIVGKKWFREKPQATEGMLFVTSMFMTLQGEGPYRGEPAFFIRLAKCNLVCSFCDTFFDDGDWLTFDQIEERVESAIEQFYLDKGVVRPEWTQYRPEPWFAADGFRNPEDRPHKRKMVLVMTGGEPMLQENMGPFLERMSLSFAKTQIESNGTQATWIPESTTLVCSPKCLEKNGKPIKYLEPRKEVLERADCLKFVMSAEVDSPYNVVPDWAHKWAETTGREIYCSPMNIYNDVPAASKKQRALNNGITLEERSTVDEVISFWEKGLLNMDENQKNHEYTAMYCVTHGFILNLQIHLLASLA